MAETQSESATESTLRRLLDSAGTGFVVATFVVPVLAAFAASGLRNVAFLNLVHVLSGVIWAGATVYVGGVLAPTVGKLDPQARGQLNTPLIPKNVALFSGVGVATLMTGPSLAVRMGLWDLANPYILAALLIALALLVGAVYLIKLQVAIFDELSSPGPPDGQRVGALAGRLSKVSPLMLVLQLAILVDMSLLATV